MAPGFADDQTTERGQLPHLAAIWCCDLCSCTPTGEPEAVFGLEGDSYAVCLAVEFLQQIKDGYLYNKNTLLSIYKLSTPFSAKAKPGQNNKASQGSEALMASTTTRLLLCSAAECSHCFLSTIDV